MDDVRRLDVRAVIAAPPGYEVEAADWNGDPLETLTSDPPALRQPVTYLAIGMNEDSEAAAWPVVYDDHAESFLILDTPVYRKGVAARTCEHAQ